MADLVSNRKAFHNYEILEQFEAGIVLQGTEVKSLRTHGGNLGEAYVKIIAGELWLLGASIAPYRFGNVHNHEEKRERKLLMHRREIAKLKAAIQQQGLAIIPLAVYLKKGKVKIKIAVARGKKLFDKRASIKERDEKRNMQNIAKNFNR